MEAKPFFMRLTWILFIESVKEITWNPIFTKQSGPCWETMKTNRAYGKNSQENPLKEEIQVMQWICLVDMAPFTAGGPDFNFCKLIAGSEGTLAFITEIKLHLVPLPPRETGLLCVHFNSIDESLRANLIALKYKPSASELIDHYILECTKDNIEQSKNRFFVQGDPGAILVIEFRKNSAKKLKKSQPLWWKN